LFEGLTTSQLRLNRFHLRNTRIFDMLSAVLLSLGVVVIGVVLFYIYKFFQVSYNLRRFRGPLAFPIIGNCYNPQVITFIKFMTVLRKQYGKIFTFYNFTEGLLVCCDPVVVRRVLSDTKTFLKGSDYSNKFGLVFGEGLVTSNGEKHKKDRGLFGRFFIRSNVLKYVDTINNVTKATMKEFLGAEGTQSVNMEGFFSRLALRNFMQFALTSDYSNDPKFEEHFCHLISTGSSAMGRLIIFNQPSNFLVPDYNFVIHCLHLLKKILLPIVEKRKLEIAEGNAPDDILSIMIRENLTQKEMEDHFNTLICAGHDTTAYFMSYFVYLIASNPEIQEKLYEQIIAKIGDREIITADDITESKYFQYCMMETLRIYSIIPMVTRVATEEVHIKEANVTIPKNVRIVVPMIIINRDPEIWENPTVFRPERFEEKGNDFTSAKDGFFPFGYGTRTCIGNTFAQIESGIVLFHLIRKFHMSVSPGFRPIILAGISLTTSNGMQIVLRPR
jgi:cytochrome P450